LTKTKEEEFGNLLGSTIDGTHFILVRTALHCTIDDNRLFFMTRRNDAASKKGLDRFSAGPSESHKLLDG